MQQVKYFKVDAIKELLYRGRFGLPGLPPPARLFGLYFLFIHDIHVNELEGADFTIEHPHPCSHRRLTNDINDVPALQHKISGALSEGITLDGPWFKGLKTYQYLQFEGVGVIRTGDEVSVN